MTHLPARYILHDLALAGELRLLTAVSVAVSLGKQQWCKVDTVPRVFALEFAVSNNAPPLRVVQTDAVETENRNSNYAGKEGEAARATRREVALVADRAVSTLGRQVPVSDNTHCLYVTG